MTPTRRRSNGPATGSGCGVVAVLSRKTRSARIATSTGRRNHGWSPSPAGIGSADRLTRRCSSRTDPCSTATRRLVS